MAQKIHKIVILGVGALGSHLVLAIRNVPARIVIVDFDRIEAKNVLAQFHTKMGAGRNKAAALQQAMAGLFGVKIEAVPHRLTADNLDVLLGGADLVVDCFDNGASRRLVQDYARKFCVPCLHGAVDAEGTYGRVVWNDAFVIDDEAVVGTPTCEGGEHLPFLIAVSAQLALAVRSFIVDGKRVGYEINPNGVFKSRE